jgi:ribulose-phosphate 3-epimerase
MNKDIKEKFKQITLTVFAITLIGVGYINFSLEQEKNLASRKDETNLGDVELVSSSSIEKEEVSDTIEEIYEYLPYIHMVLVMTVEPGFGGQGLIPETIEKVKQLKTHIDQNNIEIDIQVDGGINLDTAHLAKAAGANILVSGSAIIKSNDYKRTIENLKESIE